MGRRDEEGAYADEMMIIDPEENDGELLRTGRGTKDKSREPKKHSKGREEELEEAAAVVEDRHRDRERRRKREKDNEDRGKDHDDRKPADDRDRGRDSSSYRDRDRDRVRDKDHERRYDLARDRDKDHAREGRDRDRADRDRSKHKEKKEKHRDHVDNKDDDYVGRHKDSKGKSREKESHRGAKDRVRDRRGKECDRDERAKPDTLDGGIVAKKADEVEDDGSKDHDEKPSGPVSTSELEERLLKMKQDRLRKKSDDASEISSWVGKSRRLVDKRNAEKEKAARTSRQLEEQDNIEDESEDEKVATQCGKDLAGVKILHGLDKVIEGGSVILTLKDHSILADGDINEEMDMLENVEIGEQKLRDDAYKASKKRAGIYEDKFSDDTGSRKTILPQYDDPLEDEGVTLDETGRFTGEAEKKLEELRKRIEGGSIKRTFEDLTSSGKNSSDYFTPDEMLQFKKPKKKKSLRKREKLDLDALEAEAITAGLGTGDLGSRNDSKRQSAKEQEAKIDAEMRNSAYQSALAKAKEASKALRQEQTLTVKPMEDEDMVFGEDYEDLEKSLEQARKLALRRKEETAASGPHAVALMAIANKKEEDTQNLTTGEPQENKVVITEMEEFVLGLQFNEENQNPDSEDVFKDDEDIPKTVQHEMKPDTGGWTEMKETLKNELPASEEKEDIVPDEIIHESAVGKGLSGALKLLKERGTLKEGIDWGGRNMDKKKSKLVGINNSDGPKEIRIERTDEFGRIMTPKEAFRVISHKFHGKGPGKMKQEKRMKQYQEDLKSKQMKASDTPSLAMERMREVQAQSKMPYLVISGHVKPGQTSDPRSGFATVERDHLGSLTPMLGDKKVEHFLGINRKPDKGSMGPPPPKKPNS